ncbi:hypothetical protein [Paralimibaculum aggregatum]|nr:hypothetical protein [Limibaculum sp. NKW23]
MTNDTDKTPQKIVEIDWAFYETYLAEADLTEDEKRQFLEALWSIVVAFVDLGYGIHPVQEVCGQLGDALPAPVPHALDLEEPRLDRRFAAAAERPTAGRKARTP